MKKLGVVLSLFFLAQQYVFGQLNCPPVGINRDAKRFHLSGGIGLTYLLGDIHRPNTAGRALYGRFDYTVLKGLDLGIGAQIGSLDAVGDILDPREVKNNYFNAVLGVTAYPFVMLSADDQLGYTIGEKLLRGMYLGADVGQIFNDYTYIYRNMADLSTYGPTDATDVITTPPTFKERTSSLLLPIINAGMSLPLSHEFYRRKSYFSLRLNVQFNFASNDYLDGYVPYRSDGTKLSTDNDYYNYYSIGVKYSF